MRHKSARRQEEFLKSERERNEYAHIDDVEIILSTKKKLFL